MGFRNQAIYTEETLQNVLPENSKLTGTWALPHVYTLNSYFDRKDIQGNFQDLFNLPKKSKKTTGFISNATFSWNKTEKGIVLRSDESQYVITPFAFDGAVYSALISHYQSGELKFQHVDWIAKVKGNATNFAKNTINDLPHIYHPNISTWQQERYTPEGILTAGSIWAYSFAHSGKITHVSHTPNFSINPASCIDSDNACFYFDLTRWTWSSSVSTIKFDRLVREEPLTKEKRTWEVLQSKFKGKTVVFEQSSRMEDLNGDGKFDGENEQLGNFIFPRINILTDVDISDMDEWENSNPPVFYKK